MATDQGAHDAELESLERFVVESDDLLALESLIGRFNIFDALRIARAEIRHSNFLAFLLDPAESHGQGQLFLKALLMDLLKNAPPESRPLSPIDLDGVDLRGVEIKREWKNIDLLISCQVPAFVVVIENKIDSGEHSDQLGRYRKTVAEHYPDAHPLYVYLTLPNADEPSEDAWLPYSYESIYSVFKRTRDMYHNAIGDDVLAFLDHYLDLIGTRFMDNPKIDELCQRIYENHKPALDLIWERVGRPESASLLEVLNVLKQDPRWHVLYSSSRYVDFVPKSWMDWLPPLESEDYPLCVTIRARQTNLGYTVWLGPMSNAADRKKVVGKLREEAPGFGFKRSKASQLEGKWNRISATERFLEWNEDDEPPEPERITSAVKKTLDDLYPKLEKLALVLKPLCSVPATGG